MCINFETSIIAFLIGEISGITLFKSVDQSKKVIGLFIMFYSLVQLFEALIYKNIQTNLVSKLLLLNLGFQGFILFSLIKYYTNKENVYWIITGLIALIISLQIIQNNFKVATNILASCNNSCIKWNFLNMSNGILLYLMYGIIFYFAFTSKNIYFYKMGFVFVITLIISIILAYKKNMPSIWCLTSAISAPIALII